MTKLLGLGLALMLSESGMSADAVAPEKPPAKPDSATPAQKAESALPGDVELAALLVTDAKARADINNARAEASAAMGRWRHAAQLLESKIIPPGLKRPTKAEVEKLQKGHAEAVRKSRRLYQDHAARYAEFTARFPHHWRGHHKRAWFYADFGDLMGAAEAWRRTIVLRPGFAYAYNNLGTVYNHLGRDMESLDLYLKAISLKDDDPEFHFNFANVAAMHRFDVAKKFQWSLPKVFRESLKYYRAARDLAPDNYEYAEAVATQYVVAKHFKVYDWADEAIKDWQFCLRQSLDKAKRARVFTSLARIYLRHKKDPATARTLLLQAKELSSNATIDQLLKEANRKSGATTI